MMSHSLWSQSQLVDPPCHYYRIRLDTLEKRKAYRGGLFKIYLDLR